MDDFSKKYPIINMLDVSRETCLEFQEFASMVRKQNKKINIISAGTEKREDIMNRHIIDTAQIIDFISLNAKNASDLGSGGGFPGITAAIILKNQKKKIRIKLYEKSHNKGLFLKEVSNKLNLDTEVIKDDVFELRKLRTGSIMSRAFKPLPVILNLAYNNFESYENLILFMGKTGEETLKNTLVDWDLDFEKKKSITNNESFLLNIKKIKKKNKN
jgi:16S rRNA (guanine527-N7)-methyltransferase